MTHGSPLGAAVQCLPSLQNRNSAVLPTEFSQRLSTAVVVTISQPLSHRRRRLFSSAAAAAAAAVSLFGIENAPRTISLVITHSCVQLLLPPATRHVRAVKSAVAACRRRLRRPSLQHSTLPLLSPRHPRELFSHHSRASSCRRPHALLPGPAPSTAARANGAVEEGGLKSGAIGAGDKLKEAQCINKSLSALGPAM